MSLLASGGQYGKKGMRGALKGGRYTAFLLTAMLSSSFIWQRGINIASRCILCKEALETNKHLHYEVTTQVWALFFNLASLNWCMPEYTTDLLSCWIRKGGSKSQKKWWSTVPACIWWNIWKGKESEDF
ncbi:hypothetical protein H5410_013771 [Solanum commersonii]|uniref:Uncharacterized protein n=1 Tax=Solanum commersonii TaxID=4109 RepID=A0A9J5ZPB1_SOLCO|nr:hypothetical protein H5410_013771 [Solanum commersonii]